MTPKTPETREQTALEDALAIAAAAEGLSRIIRLRREQERNKIELPEGLYND